MKKLGIIVGVLVAGLCLASTAQAISAGPGGRVYYGGRITVGDTVYNRISPFSQLLIHWVLLL